MSTLCRGSSAVAGHHPIVVRLHSMARLRSPLSRFQKSRPRAPSVNDKNETHHHHHHHHDFTRGGMGNALQMTCSPPLPHKGFRFINRSAFVCLIAALLAFWLSSKAFGVGCEFLREFNRFSLFCFADVRVLLSEYIQVFRGRFVKQVFSPIFPRMYV